MKGADLVIRIATKGAKLAQAQLSGLGKSGALAGGKLATFAKVGATAVAGALLLLAKGLTESVQAFVSFEDKMTQSLAIMKTTVDQQKQMAMVARDVATETTVGAEQSAEAYFFLASAGLDAEQSMKALPQVAKFAQAGMFDMATATDLATDAQSALGLASKDANVNLQNLTRVTDVLVKANTLANASVQQFSEALTNKAGSALKVANKSLEEGVAVLSAFADRGVKGAEAGEKLNQLLRDVTRAVGKNSEVFKANGIVVTDAQGNMLDLATQIENLDAGMSHLSDSQKAVLLDQLGLNRGVADAVKILSGAGDQIRNYRHELEQAGGTTEMVAEKQLESFKAQTTILKNQLNNLAITIGQDLVPFLKDLVKDTQIVVERFQNFRNRVKNLERPMEVLGVRVSTIAKVLSFVFFPATTLVIGGLKKIFKWIGKSNDKYAEATNKAQQLTDAYKLQAYYTGFVATETEENTKQQLELKDVLDGTQYTVDELTRLFDENSISMDDNAKEALATAKAYEDGLMGGIQGVLNAFEQLESIQQRVGRAEQQRDKAVKAQTQAEQQLESALDQQTQARHRSKVATEESKKVSAEEELAILRQEQVVLDLAKAQDGSREKQLELQLATKELNKIRDDAIKMDSEAIKQHRLLMQSNDLVAKAEQKVKDAKQEVIDTQAKLNELTEASAKNILEQALAQEQLTRALSNFGEGTKGYEDAMKKISDITGESLDFVMKKFSDVFTEANNLSNLGADLRSTSTSSTTTNSSSTSNNGSPSVPPVSQTQFPTTTQPLTEERRADIFSRLGETNINIYQSGTIIGNDDEFVRQTAKAFEKAKKQGVVFS